MTQDVSRADPEATTPGGEGLARGSLRTWDAVAISISVLSPAMAMQLNTGGVAGTAGGSTPLAFLLGGIACLTLGFVVIGFTRRMAAAGYAYTYVSRSLGQESRLPGRLDVLLRVRLLRADDDGRGRLAVRRPDRRRRQVVVPVLHRRHDHSGRPVGHPDQRDDEAATAHRRGDRARAVGVRADRGRQGRRTRPDPVAVHLRAHHQRRLPRRLLRPDPRCDVLHRVRDGGRLRRGDRESPPRGADRRAGLGHLRDRLLRVHHLRHDHRLRRPRTAEGPELVGGRRPDPGGRALRRQDAWQAHRDRGDALGVHRVRRVRDGMLAHAVRDGPRGCASELVRPDACQVQDAGQCDGHRRRGSRQGPRHWSATASASRRYSAATRSRCTTSSPPSAHLP